MITSASGLRRRVSLALATLAALSALLIVAALWISDQWLEDAAVRDLMTRELELLQRDADTTAPGLLRLYRPARGQAPPAAIAGLAPGFYQDVGLQGSEYHVLVSELARGERVYLVYDIDFIEQRETELALAAIVIVLLVVASAALLARRTAARTLAPLEQLLAQLRQLQPEQRGQRLDLRSDDPELQVIVAAINRYMIQLDAVIERERAFAAAASHELRTPIAMLQAGIEALGQQRSDPMLGRMQRAVRDVCHQLDALLALSRLRESPPTEPLDLVHWLPALAQPFLESTPLVRVHWDLAEPVVLQAAPGAAGVIFTNLLRNALRAAGAGGEVRIAIARDEVRIADSGPGIARESLPRLFEPGFHGHDGGSGMGLYIAQTLAQRFGWALSLENRAGGGALARWRFAA